LRMDKSNKVDAAPDAAEIHRKIAEHEKAITDLMAHLYVPQKFPKMVYKDINGDGNFADPGETRTVTDDADLKAALADGWSDTPEKAAKSAAKAAKS